VSGQPVRLAVRVINRGGGASGKSYAIAQLLLYKFFTEDRKKILILRKSLPSLRLSVLMLMNELAYAYGVKDSSTRPDKASAR
jgi:phage terminase large subunit